MDYRGESDIYKALMKKEMILFDYIMTGIKEYINIAMCFRCCKFGHVAKYCGNKEICYNCGKEHITEECMSEMRNCKNCEEAGYSPRSHDARDLRCPIFQRKLKEGKSHINYG